MRTIKQESILHRGDDGTGYYRIMLKPGWQNSCDETHEFAAATKSQCDEIFEVFICECHCEECQAILLYQTKNKYGIPPKNT